jgi:hypothetical protein
VVTFSQGAGNRAREESFLAAERVRILEEHDSGAGDAHLCDGKLLVTRLWRASREPGLGRLSDDIGLLARRLLGHG